MTLDISFYQDNPVAWLEDFVGARLWYRQQELINSVRDNSFTTCKSGHSTGKTFSCAGLGLWWLINFPAPNIFLSTAPVFRLVQKVLWDQIHRLHQILESKVKWAGELLATELRFGPGHFGLGFASDNPDAVVGLHADRQLIVYDEASGISKEIFDAMSSLTAAKGNKVLLVGNPTEPNTYFHWTHTGKVPGYNRMTISSTECPNVRQREDGLYEDINPTPFPGLVSANWINQAITTHGRNSNYCKARVFGEFPTTATDQLINGTHIALAIMKGQQLRRLLEMFTEGSLIVKSEDIKRIRGL